MATRIWIALIGVCLAALTLASPRYSTVPGGNGKIAYECNGSICTIGPDGSGPINLGTGFGPTWSPEGSQIAFIRSNGNGGYNIYKMNADGSGVTQLTSFRS